MMSRTRAEIQADLDQAEAAKAGYWRDVQEATRGMETAQAEQRALLAELAKTNYGDTILEREAEKLEVRDARLVSRASNEIIDTFRAAADRDTRDVEVYVSLDPAILDEMLLGPTHELRSHLWPVVATIDSDGDVVLHVTSGDRAQS